MSDTTSPATEADARYSAMPVRHIGVHDAEWPVGVTAADAPLGLWLRGAGNLRELCTGWRSLAIVGSRAATTYGTGVAADLALAVAGHKVTIVSDTGFGIAAAAHRGARAADAPSVAVMASGIDVPHPAAHDDLIERVTERGVVVSALPLGTLPSRIRFQQRSRLLAALSAATVVVEAGRRSSALTTAAATAERGHAVGAVPGPITSAASAGAHQLLRDGTASLITDAEDCLDLLTAGE